MIGPDSPIVGIKIMLAVRDLLSCLINEGNGTLSLRDLFEGLTPNFVVIQRSPSISHGCSIQTGPTSGYLEPQGL